MRRRTRLAPLSTVQPNEAPSREEYLALVGALYAAEELLGAMEARGDVGHVHDEYRACSHAVAAARVEILKTAASRGED